MRIATVRNSHGAYCRCAPQKLLRYVERIFENLIPSCEVIEIREHIVGVYGKPLKDAPSIHRHVCRGDCEHDKRDAEHDLGMGL